MTGIPRDDWRRLLLLLTDSPSDWLSKRHFGKLTEWLAGHHPFCSWVEYMNLNQTERSGQIIDRGPAKSLRIDQHLAWRKKLTYRPESCLLLSKVHVRRSAEGYKLHINMIRLDVHLNPRQEKSITLISMFCLMLDLNVTRLSLVYNGNWALAKE